MHTGAFKTLSIWLHGWRHGFVGRDFAAPAAGDPGCCVTGCAAGPAMLVAARGSWSLFMCAPHARRWLDSREGLAAERDPRRGFRHLSCWARSAGAEASSTL